MTSLPEVANSRLTIPLAVRFVGAAVLALAATVGVLLLPFDYSAMGSYGYLGVFAVTLLASGGLVVPVPYLAIVVAAGTYLNPVLVGLVAGLAASLGELTGYILGYSGRGVAEKVPFYHKAEGWMNRYGLATIFVLSVVPNPLFDAAGLAAGALRVRVSRFWMVCFVGKTIRLIGIAALGAYLPSWFS
ncbi:MAG: VTT domain-containing protein [Chloroflexi bacterium]|nr:VTT domain-containing protein [Chloroflexota bacterium]